MQGSKSIKVRIPADVKSGAKLRVRGQGNAGRGEAKPGDLYVHITVVEQTRAYQARCQQPAGDTDHTKPLDMIIDSINPLKNPTVLISPTLGISKNVTNMLKNKRY